MSAPSFFGRFYTWTLHWCRTRYALPALILVAVSEASFFPIPPDVLLIGMTLAHPEKWLRNALCTLAASLLGGLLGWAIGFSLWQWLAPHIFGSAFFVKGLHFTPEVFSKVKHFYDANAFLAILIAPFTMIPYKIFTISAGVCAVPIPTLLLASFLGRGARFFLVAGLTRIYGAKIERFFARYYKWIALGITLLFLAAFLAVKFFKGA